MTTIIRNGWVENSKNPYRLIKLSSIDAFDYYALGEKDNKTYQFIILCNGEKTVWYFYVESEFKEAFDAIRNELMKDVNPCITNTFEGAKLSGEEIGRVPNSLPLYNDK